MHCQMEIRIIPFDSLKEFFHLNLSIQLLTYLTFQSLPRQLSCFHFTTWKLPPTLKLAITSLSSKDLTILNNYCCNYFYRFH